MTVVSLVRVCGPGARLTCTRLSPFLTLAAVSRTLTTIAQVSQIPHLSLSLSLYTSVQEGVISTTLWRRIAAFAIFFIFFLPVNFCCLFFVLLTCSDQRSRPPVLKLVFGVSRFFVCIFLGLSSGEERSEQLLQRLLTLFLRSWKLFTSRDKNLLGVWQERKEEKL